MECLSKLYVKTLCLLYLNIFMGMDTMSGWGKLPLPSMIKPKSIIEILIDTKGKNIRVDGIKVKVCRMGMVEQALCKVVTSLFADYIVGMDIISDWGVFLLPSIVREKACKSTLQAILIGHAS